MRYLLLVVLFYFATLPGVLGCLQLFQPSGVITLSGDTETCYTLTSDTILDCAGYTMYTTTYPDPLPAIYAVNADNITIKNCYIQNYTFGIRFQNTNNSRIEASTIFNSTDITADDVSVLAINMSYSSFNNTIDGVNISVLNATTTDSGDCDGGSSYAFYLQLFAANITISNTTIDGVLGTTRIDIDEAPGCQTSLRSVGNVLYMSNTENVTLFNSTIDDVYTIFGTDINSKYYNFSHNQVKNSKDELDARGDYPIITYNSFQNSTGGIDVQGDYAVVKYNEIFYGNYGILSTNSDNSNITDNTMMHMYLDHSSQYGALYVTSPTNLLLDNNTFYNISAPHPEYGAIHSISSINTSNNNITNVSTAYYMGATLGRWYIFNDTVTDAGNVSYQYGEMYFYNVTFNKSRLNLQQSGLPEAYVYNWIINNVTDNLLEPVSGATVTIEDSFGTVVDTLTTNSNGIAESWIEEYNQTNNATYVTGCVGSSSNITCLTPHNITVTKTSYQTNETTVTIDSQMEYVTLLLAYTISSVQMMLNINNTDATVYIQGTGEIASSALGTGTTVVPSYFYIASYSADVLTGLITSRASSISYSNTSTEHTMQLNYEPFPTRQIFLAFTKGEWKDIDKRMDIIVSGDFLSEITPTFGFGLGVLYPIKMITEFADIDIQSDLFIRKGTHKLEITSNRVDDGTKAIIIQDLLS